MYTPFITTTFILLDYYSLYTIEFYLKMFVHFRAIYFTTFLLRKIIKVSKNSSLKQVSRYFFKFKFVSTCPFYVRLESKDRFVKTPVVSMYVRVWSSPS